jgi:hypothetical protein
MPRQKSLVTMIRDLVRDEIQKALNRLFEGLGSVGVGPRAAMAKTKPAPKNGRRRPRKAAARKKAATPAAKRSRGGARKRRKPAAPES